MTESTQRHTCPRRMSDWGPWERTEELDEWRPGTSFVGHERDERFRYCSFCGSIDPDSFMQRIEEGWVAGPTDKNYKTYLGEPRSKEELAARRVRWLESGFAKVLARALRAEGKTDEEIEVELEKDWQKEAALVGDHDVGKFYYQHLSPEQAERFVELLNAGRMRIGYPGHFYRLPYFVVWKGAE